jgi:TRAP transporter TAXI family solute receptor
VPAARRLLSGLVSALAAAGMAAGLAAGLTAGLTGAALAQDLRFFRIGTGTTGATYFPIGGLIANAISNPPGSRPCERGGSCGVPGLIAVAQATSGSVENLSLMAAGTLESAMSQADIAFWAHTGTGLYEGEPPMTGLRAIANLYPETVHLVVRADSGIDSVDDLAGRVVSLGDEGSGTLVEARAILGAYGLDEGDVEARYLRPGPAADRLAEGGIDAFFIVAGQPVPAVADVAARVPVRLVELAGPEAGGRGLEFPFFVETEIAEGVYPGVPAARTLAVGAQWLVRADVDEELVHGITSALWHPSTRRLLAGGHPRGAEIVPGNALTGLAVPLHPGAERYYREAGLLPDEEPGRITQPPVPRPEADMIAEPSPAATLIPGRKPDPAAR